MKIKKKIVKSAIKLINFGNVSAERMKLRLLIFSLALSLKCLRVKAADLFDDQ